MGQHFRPLLFNLWGGQLLKQQKKKYEKEQDLLYDFKMIFFVKNGWIMVTMRKHIRDF